MSLSKYDNEQRLPALLLVTVLVNIVAVKLLNAVARLGRVKGNFVVCAPLCNQY